MNAWDALRLVLWMFMTQRNGQGPRRFLGLILLEWIALVLLAVVVLFGGWKARDFFYKI